MLRTTRTAPSDSKISVLIGRKHATDDRNLLFRQGSPSPIENETQYEMEQYGIEEIRGKTLGIVGYGDIGRSAGCYTRQTFAG
jgi:lactate dehydrogenase-like 2-hydroxyacid dehydrogenase